MQAAKLLAQPALRRWCAPAPRPWLRYYQLPRRQLQLRQPGGRGLRGLSRGDRLHPLPGVAAERRHVLGSARHFVGCARRGFRRRSVCGGRVHVALAALAWRRLVHSRALRSR